MLHYGHMNHVLPVLAVSYCSSMVHELFIPQVVNKDFHHKVATGNLWHYFKASLYSFLSSADIGIGNSPSCTKVSSALDLYVLIQLQEYSR